MYTVTKQKEDYKEFIIDLDEDIKEIDTRSLRPGSLCYSAETGTHFIYGPDFKWYNKHTGKDIDDHHGYLYEANLFHFWEGAYCPNLGYDWIMHGCDPDPIEDEGPCIIDFDNWNMEWINQEGWYDDYSPVLAFYSNDWEECYFTWIDTETLEKYYATGQLRAYGGHTIDEEISRDDFITKLEEINPEDIYLYGGYY